MLYHTREVLDPRELKAHQVYQESQDHRDNLDRKEGPVTLELR